MYCPECGKEKDGNFCSECGTKLMRNPNDVVVKIEDIIKKTIKETRKCSARNHAGCEITETNDCVSCLWKKANAFNKIVEFF